MKADAKTEAAVMDMYKQLEERYAKRNIQTFLDLFAPDPDIRLVGTGVDEKRVGREEVKLQAERDWSQSEISTFKFSGQTVSAAGPVAWTAGDMNIHVKADGQEGDLPCRFTGVLEQRDGRWYWVQLHVSLPSAEQPHGESWQHP